MEVAGCLSQKKTLPHLTDLVLGCQSLVMWLSVVEQQKSEDFGLHLALDYQSLVRSMPAVA
jgi:hypothetical protein